MRTPGNDVELAAGFLVSGGVISRGDQFRSAIHCGGPGTGAPITGISVGQPAEGNTCNVALQPTTRPCTRRTIRSTRPAGTATCEMSTTA